jgi:hypothetical protein
VGRDSLAAHVQLGSGACDGGPERGDVRGVSSRIMSGVRSFASPIDSFTSPFGLLLYLTRIFPSFLRPGDIHPVRLAFCSSHSACICRVSFLTLSVSTSGSSGREYCTPAITSIYTDGRGSNREPVIGSRCRQRHLPIDS